MSRILPGQDVEPLEPVVGARVRVASGDFGMTIFHAWTPPGWVSGSTVRPFTVAA